MRDLIAAAGLVTETGLEGFGRYLVFTAVYTGKYRPGKNRFWTPKMGKTGKNTTSALFKGRYGTYNGIFFKLTKGFSFFDMLCIFEK